nr:hypothetical protein [Tanacetum cinerariifolium]
MERDQLKCTLGVMDLDHALCIDPPVALTARVRYEPKTTASASKKGATNVGNASKSSSMLETTATSATQGNIPMSNPYSVLDDESDEEVENVYNESANLFQSKKTGGSSSTFTDAAG